MIQPTQIIEDSDHELSIKWSDGTEAKYTAAQLRRACPCAGCRDEWTGEKTLDPTTVDTDPGWF